MCGIAGLFIKNRRLEPELGGLLNAMLSTLCARGPDSAGFAVYGSGLAGHVKLTLRAPIGHNIDNAVAELLAAIETQGTHVQRGTHTVLSLPSRDLERARNWLRRHAPAITIVSEGQRMEIYKEVGLPTDVASAFGLQTMSGSHAIAHTRMATESAVTTNGAHPFSTGADQCLVHNGSLSNHASLRRELLRDQIEIKTENDSEVAAAYLTRSLRSGHTLRQALESSIVDLDGFYTFVVGTESGFGVLRDPIACKPAVMAENDDYVAFGSEYRTLTCLPGIDTARVWEPKPATAYFWERGS